MIKTENLVLHGIRMPKTTENDTGAEVVLEYKCEETGAKVNIFAQKSEAGKFQWIPEQPNRPDNEQDLLLVNSNIVATWAEHGMKYVRERLI